MAKDLKYDFSCGLFVGIDLKYYLYVCYLWAKFASESFTHGILVCCCWHVALAAQKTEADVQPTMSKT